MKIPRRGFLKSALAPLGVAPAVLGQAAAPPSVLFIWLTNGARKPPATTVTPMSKRRCSTGWNPRASTLKTLFPVRRYAVRIALA